MSLELERAKEALIEIEKEDAPNQSTLALVAIAHALVSIAEELNKLIAQDGEDKNGNPKKALRVSGIIGAIEW